MLKIVHIKYISYQSSNIIDTLSYPIKFKIISHWYNDTCHVFYDLKKTWKVEEKKTGIRKITKATLDSFFKPWKKKTK